MSLKVHSQQSKILVLFSLVRKYEDNRSPGPNGRHAVGRAEQVCRREGECAEQAYALEWEADTTSKNDRAVGKNAVQVICSLDRIHRFAKDAVNTASEIACPNFRNIYVCCFLSGLLKRG